MRLFFSLLADPQTVPDPISPLAGPPVGRNVPPPGWLLCSLLWVCFLSGLRELRAADTVVPLPMKIGALQGSAAVGPENLEAVGVARVGPGGAGFWLGLAWSLVEEGVRGGQGLGQDGCLGAETGDQTPRLT